MDEELEFGAAPVGLRGELTALRFVTQIATVVPAIAVQFFLDADATGACKFVGASCSQKQKREWAEDKKKKKKRNMMMIN